MSSKPESDSRPWGVPLDELEAALDATTLTVSREGHALVVRHPNFTTRVDVSGPPEPGTHDSPIEAVVRVRTALPGELATLLARPGFSAAINMGASLGAVTVEGGEVFVGSRLTVYQGDEEAWRVQFPLLLLAVIGSTDAVVGAIGQALSQTEAKPAESAWQERDFAQVREHLSRVCVCTLGGRALTAEFPLREGALSAAVGDHDTALWQMLTNQPHPVLGGGLFCLLQLRHRISDPARLDQVIAELNRREMAPGDLPPHFGAWCRGRMGNNPAYVCFLPNVLHAVGGVAVNVAFWALNRAWWANETLGSLGVRG